MQLTKLTANKFLRRHINIHARLRFTGLTKKGSFIFEHTWCSLSFGYFLVKPEGLIYPVDIVAGGKIKYQSYNSPKSLEKSK